MSPASAMGTTSEVLRTIPVAQVEPVSVLIGALGGEGGGVLTDWIVAAAMARGFPVQSTSIPGVAQRTGATTYFIELFPRPHSMLNGLSPVLALYPAPGRVDLAVMSELVEAGRALESGMVTADRTVLIASTHRIFAISEKSAMGDGRLEPGRVSEAARQMAQRAILFDMAAVAQEQDTVINAVLLGAIAGSNVLPLTTADFQQAIRKKGVAVDSNLRGFQAGLERSQADIIPPAPLSTAPSPATESAEVHATLPTPVPPDLADHLRGLPKPVQEVVTLGVSRLIDYQDRRYAELYLSRLARVLTHRAAKDGAARGFDVSRSTARHLALWMSYEDAIRVAAEKTSATRMARVRAETHAARHEPVRITEFLDPGLEEIAAIMPRPIGRFLTVLTARWERLAKWRRPMQVRTDTVRGFSQLWLMARLRRFRRFTYRFNEEQDRIEQWLTAVIGCADYSPELALEVAENASLIKGYGDTYHRGWGNFKHIYEALVAPGLRAGRWPAAEWVRQAREAALADPAGTTLDQFLSGLRPSPANAPTAPG